MEMLEIPAKAAVFDIGATLVTGPDTAPNKVIAALLGGVTAAEVASVIMTSPFDCAESVCAELEARFGVLDERARSGICDLWQAQSQAASEIEGAQDTVLTLRASGVRIGLLSDIWSPYFTGVERAIPRVMAAADSIVLSCVTGSRKPDPRNFERALDELEVCASEAVMVGDTYAHDILPALELGMRAVWVLARPDREAESVSAVLNGDLPRPTATVSDIREIASVPIWEAGKAAAGR